MSYESTLARVSQLRADLGVATGGSTTQGSQAANGAFEAALSSATGKGADASTSGLPVLSVEDQQRLYGVAPEYFNGVLPGGTVTPMGGSGSDVARNIVALAQREVGVTESPPGSNNSPRIAEYRKATAGAENSPGPWCAYFVSWLTAESGAPIGANGAGTGYVPTLESWGRQTGRFTAGGATPQPGDIVIFDWGKDGTADHTGIVEKVANGKVHTIEGNASDEVRRRNYPLDSSSVRGYVRAG